jgi:hypothetical protein
MPSGAIRWDRCSRLNVVPITEAAPSTSRASGGNRSIIAPTMAVMVGGTSCGGRPSEADSSISWMKSGFPALAAVTRSTTSRSCDCTSASAAPVASIAASRALSAGSSAPTSITSSPPSRAGSSSGRATQIVSSGRSFRLPESSPMSFRSEGPAHSRPSHTTTNGFSAAIASSSRAAHVISSIPGRFPALSRSASSTAPTRPLTGCLSRSASSTWSSGTKFPLWPYEGQLPVTAGARSSPTASRTRRDLPMPGGPSTAMSLARRSRATPSYTSRSKALSLKRFTIRVGSDPSPDASPVTRNAGTGSAFPLSDKGAIASMVKRCRARLATVAFTTISPAVAADWSRAARLTTSPTTRSPAWDERVTSASPAAIPEWTATTESAPAGLRSPPTRSRIWKAARSARSASSSCEVTAPNTAMMASPMNFSTSPPCSATADEQIP